ncbi:MAG TPA: hypothetical protein VF163_04730 [Micromonosporaceae bacterium]
MTEPYPEPPTTPATEPEPPPATPPAGQPALPTSAAPAGAPAYPDQTSTPAYPGDPGPPPRKRRVGLIVGLVFAAVLVLCGGGGVGAYLLVQNAEPRGSANPDAAIDGFLGAVYQRHSASEAARYVCPAARDEKDLSQLVDAVQDFESQYESPRTTWDHPTVKPAGAQAETVVTLTLRTANEQVATKKIWVQLLDARGWWVCDVANAD